MPNKESKPEMIASIQENKKKHTKALMCSFRHILLLTKRQTDKYEMRKQRELTTYVRVSESLPPSQSSSSIHVDNFHIVLRCLKLKSIHI